MTAAPVQSGTAEALARVHHFHAVEHVQPEELEAVARHLIGHVDDHRQVLRHLHDQLEHLYALITDDWTDDQLDELNHDTFATRARDVDARLFVTVTRLTSAIEGHIWLARYRHAHTQRGAA